MVHLRRFILASATFAGLLLSGCATVVSAPDPLQSPPTAGQSVVVLSITGNTTQVAAPDRITVLRRNPADPAARESHVLRQVAPGMARDTSMFVGTLPTGEYDFASLDFAPTQQFLNINEVGRKRIGSFAVVGGKNVDLGRLLITPLNSTVLVGRSGRVLSNLELVRRFAPDYLRFFDGQDLALGWQGPRTPTDRVEEYALAITAGADQPYEMADGSVVMGSRLGTALVRSPEGKWSTVRSEGLEALLCVRPGDTADTHLVAVGEFGTLLRAAKGSNKFSKVDPGNLPPGNLIFISGNSQSGWVLLHQKGSELQFLRSPTLEAGQWTPLRRVALERSLWSGAEQMWPWSRPEGFAYATGDQGVHFYDQNTAQWRSAEGPKGQRIIAVAPDAPDHLGLITSPGGGFAGIFANQFVSRDSGANWQEVKTEFKIKVGPPRRARNGDLLTMGGVFSQPELHASSDDGKTWAKRSDFQLDQTLHILPSGLMMAMSRGNVGLFSVRVSADQGKTWKVEYSNFDRQAFEAQQRR
jgi:hypothetical protein